jgi:hypothetical protein
MNDVNACNEDAVDERLMAKKKPVAVCGAG